MRRTGTFYEIDVLEAIKGRLEETGRVGAAVDAGAFIGTHSIFFAAVCGLDPVLAFEPHPHSQSLLVENVNRNGLIDHVLPIQQALAARNGYGALIEAAQNKGKSSIAHLAESNGERVEVSTLDSQLAERAVRRVALIKIDVEGGELEVLKGAQQTLATHRPLLCIEAHTYAHLRDALLLLSRLGYVPIDCLGWSPTYILDCARFGLLKRFLVRMIWLLRARLPRENQKVRECLRQLGRRATSGT
jgi:FkbM family methyltransferase